jgi:hypothetical protein
VTYWGFNPPVIMYSVSCVDSLLPSCGFAPILHAVADRRSAALTLETSPPDRFLLFDDALAPLAYFAANLRSGRPASILVILDIGLSLSLGTYVQADSKSHNGHSLGHGQYIGRTK